MPRKTALRTLPGEIAALVFANEQLFFRYETDTSEQQIKCVSPEAVRAAFNLGSVDSGWLPPQVRRWGYGLQGEWALMFFPPGRHTLAFVSDFLPTADEEVVSLQLALPALTFLGYGRDYYCWALKSGRTLDPQAAVCHAPLPNLSRHGRICYGENRYPDAGAGTIAAAWQLFLDSPFTGHSVDGKSRRHAEDVRHTLREVAEAGRRAYPLKDLRGQQRSLARAVESVLDTDRHNLS